MIVRSQDSDNLILVPQTDHSKLVGQIAAQWGNKDFETPRPFVSVTRAATCHDFGWIRYESDPTFDPDTGGTLHYLQVPNTTSQLRAFQDCADWLAGVDPYSALMVDMHRTGLWRRRYNVIEHPKAYLHPVGQPSMPLTAEIEAFIARSEALQEQQRSKLNEGEIWTNYRLLQVWDLLGLYFSCHDPDGLHIMPVPQGYSLNKTDGVRMTMTPVGGNEVAFDPFPFREKGTKISLLMKRLPQRKYGNAQAFKSAYFQARSELMTFTLS